MCRMDKREVKYMVNYHKEISQIIKRYDLSDDTDKINCADEIKEILIIDMDCAIKNDCTMEFKQILSILIDRIEKLQSYNIPEFLSYVKCIVDMLEIFENEIYVNI